MYTVDLPATWIAEREAEIKAAAAARNFSQTSGQASQTASACHSPLPSPSTGFGFLSGFFSSFARSADSTPTTMSRSTSSCGNPAAGGSKTSSSTYNNANDRTNKN